MPEETEHNKRLARAFFDALSRSDVTAIVEAFADDGKCYTMGNTAISGVFDRQQIELASSSVLGAFPKGISFAILDITAEDDRVAVEAVSQAIHVSGKPYGNQYHFLMRYRSGKLVELKEYMDTEMVTDVLCDGRRRA